MFLIQRPRDFPVAMKGRQVLCYLSNRIVKLNMAPSLCAMIIIVLIVSISQAYRFKIQCNFSVIAGEVLLDISRKIKNLKLKALLAESLSFLRMIFQRMLTRRRC